MKSKKCLIGHKIVGDFRKHLFYWFSRKAFKEAENKLLPRERFQVDNLKINNMGRANMYGWAKWRAYYTSIVDDVQIPARRLTR